MHHFIRYRWVSRSYSESETYSCTRSISSRLNREVSRAVRAVPIAIMHMVKVKVAGPTQPVRFDPER